MIDSVEQLTAVCVDERPMRALTSNSFRILAITSDSDGYNDFNRCLTNMNL